MCWSMPWLYAACVACTTPSKNMPRFSAGGEAQVQTARCSAAAVPSRSRRSPRLAPVAASGCLPGRTASERRSRNTCRLSAPRIRGRRAPAGSGPTASGRARPCRPRWPGGRAVGSPRPARARRPGRIARTEGTGAFRVLIVYGRQCRVLERAESRGIGIPVAVGHAEVAVHDLIPSRYPTSRGALRLSGGWCPSGGILRPRPA